MPEGCKRAKDGGFAAKTPQQSGAATTSASVRHASRCSHGTPAAVFLPSARHALDLEILHLSEIRPSISPRQNQVWS